MGKNFTAKNPQVTVNVEVAPDYWSKLEASIVGGSGPDIFLMNNVTYYAWSFRGLPADITEQFKAEANAKDFQQQAWKPGLDFYNYNGKFYGLPYMMTSIITLYNEEAMKEAGLKSPAELGKDWNWDKLQEYAVKLTKREGDKATRWGLLMTRSIELEWLNFVRGNGGDFLSPDRSKCIIDQPPSIEAWETLAGLYLKQRVAPTPEELAAVGQAAWSPAGNWFKLMAEGKVAMWVTASNAIQPLKEGWPNLMALFNYGYVPLSPKTGKSGGTTNITGWCINRNTKTPDQTWGFLSHMLTKESGDILAKYDVLRPARDDSAQLYYDPKLTGGPANRKAAFEMFQWTTALPTHDRVPWTQMLRPVGPIQNDIYDGKVSAKEGLTRMAAEVNAIFAAAK